MWPVSEKFLAALQGDTRQWLTKIDVISKRKVVRRIQGVIDGDVTFSNTSIRRTCRFTFIDLDGELLPVTDHDLLAPRGTEVRIWKGLNLDPDVYKGLEGKTDGQPDEVEWVPLGVFVITEVNIQRSYGGALIEVVGSDRGDAVRRRLFREPNVIPDDTLATQAIEDICTGRYPTPVNMVPSDATVPELLFDVGDDPWDAAQEIAQGANMYAYYDPMGVLTTRMNRTLGGEPTGVSYMTNEPDSLVLSIERAVLSDNVYSGVIVHVEHPDRDPIHVEVWDDDPTSATYYLGPFGRKPLVIETSAIRTLNRAENLANRLVNGVVAGFGTKVVRQRQVASLNVAGHPGHDVGDRIFLKDEATQTRRWWIVVGGKVSLRGGNVSLALLSGVGQEGFGEDRTPVGDPEDQIISIITRSGSST